LIEIKKIVLTGVESTGKSTLAKILAKHFNTVSVPEYARVYLQEKGRNYTQADLLQIAKGQLLLEDTYTDEANKILFCDTNLQVIQLWSQELFNNIDPAITQLHLTRTYHHYLLLAPDITWQPDPLRTLPQQAQRDELHNLYLQDLQNNAYPFTIINGNYDQRKKLAIEVVEKFLEKNKW
jgi:NadR type nicotinamide-nucleotide adenylyltransferase